MKKITDSIYYTGVLNPNMRVFDITMRTDFGTSYNSYTVIGSEKIALIEAAHADFTEVYLQNVEESLAGRKPDYLIINHCEPDHTGTVEKLLERYPELVIVTSPAGSSYIKAIVNNEDLNLKVVKDKDNISLGDKTLQFIIAPFLHWPDSMFTWIAEEKALFSCDFLGCHFCEPLIFDTEIVHDDEYWQAVQYYFDCIFAPYKPYVLKGLSKILDLDISFACTSHGPVLTKAGHITEVIDKYKKWATPCERTEKLISVFYCSAYGNTEKLAEAIVKGIKKTLPTADIFTCNIIDHDLGDLQGLMNESDAFLIGSPTINQDAVAPVWQLLGGIEAITIKKRPVAIFGSFGWSGEALANIFERLTSVGCKVFPKQLKTKFLPAPAELEEAEKFGKEFAETI